MTLTTEQLRADRIDEVRELWKSLHTHSGLVGAHLGPLLPPDVSWERRRRRYLGWFETDDAFAFLAKVDGHAIGYAFVFLRIASSTWALSERTAELATLAVLPENRGQGVGKALMDAMFDELRRRGIRDWRVSTLTTNVDAIRFYKKFGVIPMEESFLGHVPNLSQSS